MPIWTQKYASGEYIYLHVYVYKCVCVCVQNQSYEGTQTDRWLANVRARTHTRVTFAHQLLHFRPHVCWDSRISSLFKSREEKLSQRRVGKEGGIPCILQMETLGKCKSTCNTLGTTCCSISADFGGYWTRLRMAHGPVHCEGFKSLQGNLEVYPNFTLERMQPFSWRWVSFEKAL